MPMHNVVVFHWLMLVNYHRNVLDGVVDCRDYVRREIRRMSLVDEEWIRREDSNHNDREFFASVMGDLSRETDDLFRTKEEVERTLFINR